MPTLQSSQTAVASARQDALTAHSADQPAALIVGGGANALSIARSLGRAGVATYAINKPTASVKYSRFARWISVPDGPPKDVWTTFLLGSQSDSLRGAVLLPACDDALELFIEHHDQLSQKYRLDLFVPSAQAAMLDKLATYEAAREAGVATPRFWLAKSREQIESWRDELVFPLLMKPLLSHRFTEKFGVKFLVAENYVDLCEAWSRVDGQGLEVMLVEKIPGPDSQLCSYYTYIDENGDHLFRFTKRIVRRFPPEMGIACRHVTDHIPELTEPATALFRQVGLRGLANVEFKLDSRDRQLKLIECNARVTAANVLLDRCGYDLAQLVYQRATTGKPLAFGDYPKGVHLWNPIDDLRAFIALRRGGRETFSGWLRSIARPRVALPYFQWNDPMPAIVGIIHRLRRLFVRSSNRTRSTLT